VVELEGMVVVEAGDTMMVEVEKTVEVEPVGVVTVKRMETVEVELEGMVIEFEDIFGVGLQGQWFEAHIWEAECGFIR
jgi:hypothetical protein